MLQHVTDRTMSSNAATRKIDKLKGAIAQLGERLPCTQEVGGSIPPGSTIVWVTNEVKKNLKGCRKAIFVVEN